MPAANNASKESPAKSNVNTADFRSREERLAAGKSLRDSVPRTSHAVWTPTKKRLDPIQVLEKSNEGRVDRLIPIRYGRMLRSPFTFLRGSAALMAYDLSSTPSTGIRVQACGDSHLANFGLFATPERNLVFDINDFDETLPAPWEWDVKRLAASFMVAGRDKGFSDEDARSIAIASVRAYREHLRAYSKMSPLDIWYDHLDAETLIDMAPDAEARKTRKQMADKASKRIGEYLVPKIATTVGGQPRLLDQPPVLFHVSEDEIEELKALTQDVLNGYRLSLPDERRVLFDRYRLVDLAAKVVGIGSVGTRCFVCLFYSQENHPLLLQVKEARPSVLEPYAGKSEFASHGQRVVVGQRLTQTSSDIFLGWAQHRGGFHFFLRQLRDMKFSVPVDELTVEQITRYAEVCGWTLSRSHAKSGDAVLISGYLGKSDTFDQAIGQFAQAYADQTEEDHAALVAAEKTGRIKALIEEDL